MLSRSLITLRIASLPVAFCLELWLSVLLYRRRVYKLAPVFFSYIAASVVVSLARLLTINHYDIYYFVYWASEALLILLSLSALNQVFWLVYEPVRFIWWFRLLYYGAILIALGVTIRAAIVSPPLPDYPEISFIVDAEITANIVRAGIVALFAAMVNPMAVRFQRYPFGIILGFGASSLGPCISYFIFSVFGTKVQRYTDLVAALSYIAALLMWLRIFSLPDTKLTRIEPPIPPEEMWSTVDSY
ncbi:MAG TPA: hypothetical protein VFP71_15360, partial [Candidatus Angelobacter sp.]|nr:hypothetical protein [Candidatus Angelobacter sp.]